MVPQNRKPDDHYKQNSDGSDQQSAGRRRSWRGQVLVNIVARVQASRHAVPSPHIVITTVTRPSAKLKHERRYQPCSTTTTLIQRAIRGMSVHW
jgi:hypothetical protein